MMKKIGILIVAFLLFSCFLFDDREEACLMMERENSAEEILYIKQTVAPVDDTYKCRVEIIDGTKYPEYEIDKAFRKLWIERGSNPCPLAPPEEEDCL